MRRSEERLRNHTERCVSGAQGAWAGWGAGLQGEKVVPEATNTGHRGWICLASELVWKAAEPLGNAVGKAGEHCPSGGLGAG